MGASVKTFKFNSKKPHSSPVAVQSGEHHVEAGRGFPCVGNIWGICGRHMGNLQAVLMAMFKKVEAIARGEKKEILGVEYSKVMFRIVVFSEV